MAYFRSGILLALLTVLAAVLASQTIAYSENTTAAHLGQSYKSPDAPTQLVPHQCGDWFLSGVNVPWQNGGYGADFGTVEEWNQHTYSAAATNQMFAELRESNVNTVRWWVFTDGRGAPEFNSNNGGTITGLDANFLPSMESAIRLAEQHDIYIIFTLWDFGMFFADSTISGRGEHAGGHANIITSSSGRQSFINNALLPMLDHSISGTPYKIGTHPNVLAWEVMNEPEWAVSDLDALDERVVQPVTLAQMQRFTAEVSSAIHSNSNQMVTVGSAALKWNSDTALGATGNVWKDSELQPYAANGTLDFYQFHYYSWMDGDGQFWSYSPLFNSFEDASLDKPTIIGEFSANGGGKNLLNLLNGMYDNGYAGFWSWGYHQVDANGGWSDSESAFATFNAAHFNEVNIRDRCIELDVQSYIPMTVRE